MKACTEWIASQLKATFFFKFTFCLIFNGDERDITFLLSQTCTILHVLFRSAVNVRLNSASTLNYFGPHNGEKFIWNAGNNVICNNFYCLTIFTALAEFHLKKCCRSPAAQNPQVIFLLVWLLHPEPPLTCFLRSLMESCTTCLDVWVLLLAYKDIYVHA